MKSIHIFHYRVILIGGFGAVLLFAMGCTHRPIETTSIPGISPTAETTFLPTRTMPPLSTPTGTPLPAQTDTATATTLPTATPIPEIISIKCLDPIPAQFSDLDLNGVLAIYHNPDDTNPDNYLVNLETGEKFDIVDHVSRELEGFIVSPDRKYLAYVDSSAQTGYSPDDRYIIIDATGRTVVSHYAEANWSGIVDWQDREHLLIMEEKWNSDGGYIETPAALIRWNPFTGEQERLEPAFPDIYALPVNFWGAYYYNPTIYDPNMDYVIYPFAHQGVFGIALWDLISEHRIVNLASWDWGTQPVWSPDGQSFLTNPY